MGRGFNVDLNGKTFGQATIDIVWEKAIKYTNNKIDSNYVRKDICGTAIFKIDYGKTEGYGWEIDHIKPIAKGGTDDISNLQPLYWENNRSKRDNLDWTC